jgi:phage/plasmid-like protein (TIGR03299 family)
MAANIEIRTIGGREVASFVENGKKERAWHRLGQVYDRPLTVVEAINGCHADFEVGLQPIIAATPQLENLLNGGMSLDSDMTKVFEGKQFVSIDMLKDLIIKGRKATMRYDYNEPLAVVSDQYGVVQYQKAFEFVDLLTTGKIDGETPTIECAGLLGQNGSRLFITAKFPEPIVLGKKDDTIDQYIIFTTSHDGSGAVTCMCSNVRVVCNNTLNLALRNNSGKITFKHTSRVNERLDLLNKQNADMAYRTLGLYKTYKEYFEGELQALAKITLSDKEQEKILAEALFTPDVWKVYKAGDYNLNNEDISTKSRNIMESVKDTIYTGIGQDSLENGTALKLINGVSCFYQNVATWGDNEKKFNAIMDGSVQKKLQTVHDLVFKLAA